MFQPLVEAISIPALLVDDDGYVAAANKGMRELLGAGIAGRHYITALRQPPLLDAIERAGETGTRQVARYLASDARGDVTYRSVIAPLGTDGSLLICFEDRTAKEEAGLMRRDFVANVSHELRTPLTALIGFIETLRGAARTDEVARDRFLTIMEAEANRMARLVSDLLSLSSVEAEERVRPRDEVSLAAVVRTVLDTLAPRAEERGVVISALGLDAEALVPGDEDQLAQVVTNLLENAIKYSGKDARVDVALKEVDSHPLIRGAATLLSVTDTGEGIDPIHIPRLTERFYRIDSHRSREVGGTGLGLAIVKHIVNRHRGRLTIESTPGQGSCFSVILPSNQ